MRKKKQKNILKQMNIPLKSSEIIPAIKSIDSTKYPAFHQVLDFLKSKNSQHIYCLGLGDPCKSLACRTQISFITSISKELNINQLFYYDPLLCSDCLEHHILQDLGFSLIDTKEKNIGDYKATDGTIFFMPHCPSFLYHNLIISNLSQESFKNLIIIGNSFENHAEQVKYDCEMQKTIADEVISKEFMKEIKLNFLDDLFFYSTSIMYANDSSKLPPDDDSFWKNKEYLPDTVET